MIRSLNLALLVGLATASGATAQDAQFNNPTPIDTTRPFLYDGIRPPTQMRLMSGAVSHGLAVESYSREDLLKRGSPTAAALVRGLAEVAEAPALDLTEPFQDDRVGPNPSQRLVPPGQTVILRQGIREAGITAGVSPRTPPGQRGQPGNMTVEALRAQYGYQDRPLDPTEQTERNLRLEREMSDITGLLGWKCDAGGCVREAQ